MQLTHCLFCGHGSCMSLLQTPHRKIAQCCLPFGKAHDAEEGAKKDVSVVAFNRGGTDSESGGVSSGSLSMNSHPSRALCFSSAYVTFVR